MSFVEAQRSGIKDDVMHQIACSRWMVVVGLVLFTIWLSALAVGLLAIYVADEYVTPSFSEQSVPPPRLY
jgi:hypothetical protein